MGFVVNDPTVMAMTAVTKDQELVFSWRKTGKTNSNLIKKLRSKKKNKKNNKIWSSEFNDLLCNLQGCLADISVNEHYDSIDHGTYGNWHHRTTGHLRALEKSKRQPFIQACRRVLWIEKQAFLRKTRNEYQHELYHTVSPQFFDLSKGNFVYKIWFRFTERVIKTNRCTMFFFCINWWIWKTWANTSNGTTSTATLKS